MVGIPTAKNAGIIFMVTSDIKRRQTLGLDWKKNPREFHYFPKGPETARDPPF